MGDQEKNRRRTELKDDKYLLDCMCGKRFGGKTLKEAESKFFGHQCQEKRKFANASNDEAKRFSKKEVGGTIPEC